MSVLPGEDRHVWRPCRNKVAAGKVGCADCLNAAANHSVVGIRLQVAESPDIPDDLLELLTTDPEQVVAQAAMAQQNRRRLASESEEPMTFGLDNLADKE